MQVQLRNFDKNIIKGKKKAEHDSFNVLIYTFFTIMV